MWLRLLLHLILPLLILLLLLIRYPSLLLLLLPILIFIPTPTLPSPPRTQPKTRPQHELQFPPPPPKQIESLLILLFKSLPLPKDHAPQLYMERIVVRACTKIAKIDREWIAQSGKIQKVLEKIHEFLERQHEGKSKERFVHDYTDRRPDQGAIHTDITEYIQNDAAPPTSRPLDDADAKHNTAEVEKRTAPVLRTSGGLKIASPTPTKSTISMNHATASPNSRAAEILKTNPRKEIKNALHNLTKEIFILLSEENDPFVLELMTILLHDFVIKPVFDMVCEPDYWNVLINYYATEKEVKYSDKFRDALDRRDTDDEAANYQFEYYMQQYKSASNIQEIRTVRHEIKEVIRKLSMDQGSSGKVGNKKHPPAEKLMKRLSMIVKRADKKIGADKLAISFQPTHLPLSTLLTEQARSYLHEYTRLNKLPPYVDFLLTAQHMLEKTEDKKDDLAIIFREFFSPSARPSMRISVSVPLVEDPSLDSFLQAKAEIEKRVEEEILPGFWISDLGAAVLADPKVQNLAEGVIRPLSAPEICSPGVSENYFVKSEPVTPAPERVDTPHSTMTDSSGHLQPPPMMADLRRKRMSLSLGLFRKKKGLDQRRLTSIDSVLQFQHLQTRSNPDLSNISGHVSNSESGFDAGISEGDEDHIEPDTEDHGSITGMMSSIDEHEVSQFTNTPASSLSEASDEDSIVNLSMASETLHSLEHRIGIKLSQLKMVERLAKKAENGGQMAEARVFQQSRANLYTELLLLKKERTEVELDDPELIIPVIYFHVWFGSLKMLTSTKGYTHARVTAATNRAESASDDSKTFILYTIEIERYRPGFPSTKWSISRRYSEFFSLHQSLKVTFPQATLRLDFPAKAWWKGTVRPKEVESRCTRLEKYLQDVIQEQDIGRSMILRAFLAANEEGKKPQPLGRKQSFVGAKFRSIVRSVSEGVEDVGLTFSRNATTLDRLREKPVDSDLEEDEKSRITSHLCDLFIEVFELKDKTNWLRKQAVQVILQQILGGTIERKVIENVKYLMDDEMITWYIDKIKDTVWPDGVLVTSWPIRSTWEQKAAKSEALRKIQIYIPDLLGGMVGRGNARRGARKVFDALQDQARNETLALELLLVGLDAMFPDKDWERIRRGSEGGR